MKNDNPWVNISLRDYEEHMKLDDVQQLQTLNMLMKEQIEKYPISTLSILGIAGGNGLEHVSPPQITRVYGIDVNSDYLKACNERYIHLNEVFIGISADITDPSTVLPQSEMVIANLFIEYIGLDIFTCKLIHGNYLFVSCVIQENKGNQFVSKSPYEKALTSLTGIHTNIQKEELIHSMEDINYKLIFTKEYPLPNGKVFQRVDFKKQT